MIIVVVFLSALAAIAVWYLAGENLAAKPWLEQGVIGDLSDPDERRLPWDIVGADFWQMTPG